MEQNRWGFNRMKKNIVQLGLNGVITIIFAALKVS